MGAGIWIFAVIAVSGALILGYFLGAEVLGLVRDFVQTARDRNASAIEPQQRRNRRMPQDTGPLNPERVIGPFQDRETVERLITYFEQDEGEERSAGG